MYEAFSTVLCNFNLAHVKNPCRALQDNALASNIVVATVVCNRDATLIT